jgi:hypothetical protein
MANQKTAQRPKKLEPDELVERLVPDASQVPDVRVLVGFLGRSTREGYWRLYLTPTLNEYVEFAQGDVVHSHAFESDVGRLAGTVVWVKRAANLQHTRNVSREAQADFLQGAITAGVSRGVRRGVGGQILALQPPLQQFLSFAGHANSCVSDICNVFLGPSFLGGNDVYCYWSVNGNDCGL